MEVIIEWFKELGYDYLHGYDIAPPERNNYQEVLLSSRFHTALIKLNPTLQISAIDEAVNLIQKPQHATLTQNNRAFHKMVMQQEEVLSDEWSHSEYDTPVKPYAVNNSDDGELMVADDAKREYGEKDGEQVRTH